MRSDLVAHISIDNLVHNFRSLREACRSHLVKLCAPLKADAYGHGLKIVAPALHAAGADYGAVANLTEAIELRAVGWVKPILVLGNVLAVADEKERRERIDAVVEHDLTLTVVDEETVRHLREHNPPTGVRVHVKVDTGMGRMGVMPDRVGELVRSIRVARCLQFVGIYSHFATADMKQRELARKQLSLFNHVLTAIRVNLPPGVIKHISNSAATIAMPDAHLDMVRPGLALYGYYPASHMAELIYLKPVLRLTTHLASVKELPVGHCVGYGQTFTTKRPTRIGIIPAGYFDGFIRMLSNNAVVGTPGGDAPVVGRVSMDQFAVDLTDLPPMGVGTPVTLIDDKPGRPNSVAGIAKRMNTIPYEVTCLLGSRVERTPTTSLVGVHAPVTIPSSVNAPPVGGSARLVS
ncbi:MAG: alanine racemase [Phycisphaerae bacterium]|nr:alanine racemase [Phycisphaerae bacterium]